MKRLEPEVEKRLTSFIEIYSDDVDIQFNPAIERSLPFSVPVEEKDKDTAAHYLLLAASISDIEVVGNARNSRLLLSYICEKIDSIKSLFDMGELEFYEKTKGCKRAFNDYSPLGEDSKEIPKILSSVNEFVKRKAKSGLVAYSRQLSKTQGPADMVKALSEIDRMNEYNLAKAWLYLRWMVRGWPDLRLFDTFSPSDLQIPLTIPALRVAKALNQAEKSADVALESRISLEEWWKKNPEAVETTSRNLNLAVGELCPGDPAKADYPFFILGRWLSGLELNHQTVIDTLDLFINQYSQLKLMFGKKYKPIDYIVMKERKQNLFSQTTENKMEDAQSGLERNVMKYLRDAKIHADFEPLTANFPKPRESNPGKPVSYTPDFVVRSKRERGRKVALDPHGIWIESKELEWTMKNWALFKGTYSNYCKLRIIVPDSLVIKARKIVRKKGLKDQIWSESKFKNSLKEEFS